MSYPQALIKEGEKLSEFSAAHLAGFLFGQRQGEIRQLEGKEGEEDGVPFVFLNGQAVGLKQFMAPRLGKMSPDFTDASSLIWYVNKYKNADTLIFAKFETAGGLFTAIIDYPGKDNTSRKEHVVTFRVEPTPEWKAISDINEQALSHDKFCEFVERWKHLFGKPSGTDMLEMSRYIEGKKDGQFIFGKRMSNGDRQVFWKEQTQITAGATGNGEPTEIPESLIFRLALFEGTEPIEVEAFLRCYVQHGMVAFRVEVKFLERIIREAMGSLRDSIRDETGVPVVLGKPGSNVE